jgi:predicted ester cyclase
MRTPGTSRFLILFALSLVALATHRALFDALRAKDAHALAPLYAPDAAVSVGLGLALSHGADAAATLADTLFTAFPDSRLQWSKLYQAGDAIAVELAWMGTNRGPLRDAAATNRMVGTSAFLLTRFAPGGRIQTQHLYFDADALGRDLASRGMKLFGGGAFVGLPTAQTMVLDHAVATADDDAAMRGLVASFMRGNFEDARPLAQATTTWTEVATGHTATGKAAVAAWVSFLQRSFSGSGKQLIDVWSTGECVLLEWSTSSGGGAEGPPDRAGSIHAAEVIRFDGGHLAEVRTYRSSVHKADAESRRHGAAASPRGTNQ